MSKVNRIEAVMSSLDRLETTSSRPLAEWRPAQLRAAAFTVADATAAGIAWLGAVAFLRALPPLTASNVWDASAGVATALWLVSAACLVGWLAARGHHNLRLSWQTQVSDVLAGSAVALATTAVCAILFTAAYGDDWSMPVGVDFVSRSWLALWLIGWVLFVPTLMLMRALARTSLRAAGLWSLRTIIVAPRETADAVAAALRSDGRLGFEVVGDLDPGDLTDASLLRGVDPRRADLLVVAADLSRPDSLDRTISRLKSVGLPIATTLVHPGLSGLGPRNRAFAGHDVMLLASTKPSGPVGGFWKQAMDRSGAAILLLLLAPLFLLLVVLIRRDGAAAIFKHQRLGANGQMFPCMKFRTMVANADKVLEKLIADDPAAALEWHATQKLRNDPRITGIGQLLRKSSLDELPQLFNVLRGEMSLVGPRPIVRAEITRYGSEIRYYYQARPGLTGLWQVSGRSDTSYAQRVELDVHYVSNWTLWRDIVIVFKTIPAVLLRKGAV